MDAIFNNTKTLLMAIDNTQAPKTFLRDRYCPRGGTFATEEVVATYRDGRKKLAPLVSRRMGSVQVERGEWTAQKFTPPYFAPHRTITLDTLQRKQWGEALYRDRTPQQREAFLLMEDIEDMRAMHIRREEMLIAQLMQHGYIELKEYIEDRFTGVIVRADYYTPFTYAPPLSWDDPAANILADCDAVIDFRKSKGLPTAELVVHPDVCEAVIRNDDVYKFLDNNRFQMGLVAPSELQDGVSGVGFFQTFKGRRIFLMSYDETYEDDNGVERAYMDEGKIVFTAPAMARMHFGAITQMERDERLHTYPGAYVPRMLADVRTDSRELRIASAPLPVPTNKDAFTPVEVLF